MELSPGRDGARGEVIERVEAAKRDGMLLYICGVKHVSADEVFLSEGEVVRAVHPALVYLEGRTPDSTYKNGRPTGEFLKELQDSEPYPDPNIVEIGSAVDDLGCGVRGCDLSEEAERELYVRLHLTNERLKGICRQTQESIAQVTQGSHDDESFYLGVLYNELKFLQDESEGDWDPADETVNAPLGNYEKLRTIQESTSARGEIADQFKSGLDAFAEDMRRYGEARDAEMFSHVKQGPQSGIRTLLFVGSGNIKDPEHSHLLSLARAEKIPFLAFKNYDDSF